VVERYQRVVTTRSYNVFIEDPKVFTTPEHMPSFLSLRPGERLRYECIADNQSIQR
jgi:hypothetical protein